MKKNNSLKIFNKLAKRAYKVSKKRKLDWKWRDAQKWTSANLFKKYKGTKGFSKVKVTDIDKEVESILDFLDKPQPVDDCFSVFDTPDNLLDTIDWFEIDEVFPLFNDNVQIDLNLIYNGQEFANTGVIKKGLVTNILDIREDIRKAVKNGSGLTITFSRVLIENRLNDRKINCNFYILITFEDSDAYNLVRSKGLIQSGFVSVSDIPLDEQQRIAKEQAEQEEEKKNKVSKKKIKAIELPKQVEPKLEQAPKTKDEIQLEKLKEFNLAVANLKDDLKQGLIDKEDYKAFLNDLRKNLEKGGKI